MGKSRRKIIKDSRDSWEQKKTFQPSDKGLKNMSVQDLRNLSAKESNSNYSNAFLKNLNFQSEDQ